MIQTLDQRIRKADQFIRNARKEQDGTIYRKEVKQFLKIEKELIDMIANLEELFENHSRFSNGNFAPDFDDDNREDDLYRFSHYG